MHPEYRLISPAFAGLLLTCLLLAGCATESALQTQTQPLQEHIERVEQALVASNQATRNASEKSADALAERQSDLEKQVADMTAQLAKLRDQLQARESIAAETQARGDTSDKLIEARIGHIENRLDATATRAEAADRQNAQQNTQLKNRQQADAAVVTAMAANLSDAERRLEEMSRLAQASSEQMSKRMDALQARQESDTLADEAVNQRLRAAEDKLTTLSGLVQEALALAAKELFLANGREAFTVMLTEDKVLYPQNDPHLDSNDVAKLNVLAVDLGKLDQEYHLDIQGHTANNSTEDNNYNLGKARAEVVKRYLHEKKGISISRMSTLSYGANKPLNATNGSNRRIYIRVLVLK